MAPAENAPSQQPGSFTSATATLATLRFAAQTFKDPADDDDDDDLKPMSLQLPLREGEQQALERLRAALRTEFASDSLLPPEDFLRKCLVYQKWDVDAAAVTAKGFVNFRRSAGWPLRIRARDVETPLRTGLHWLLWPKASPAAAEQFPPTAAASAVTSHRWADGGPGACLVFNMAKLNVDLCGIADFQKMSMFLMEQATDSEVTQQRGIAVVADFKGVSMPRLLSILSFADMKRGVLLWKGAFPCRLRRIWVVNAPAGIQSVAKGIIQLLRPKTRQRVRVLSRKDGLEPLVEDLGSVFDLPSSLGGPRELPWDQIVSESFLSKDLEPEKPSSTPNPEAPAKLPLSSIGKASRGADLVSYL